MSRPLTAFPDPLAETLTVLRARLPGYAPGVVCGTRDYPPDDPDRPALPYLVLAVDAVIGQWPVTRTATVRVLAHDRSAARAARLAGLAQAVLLAYPGDERVRGFAERTGPMPATDPDTGAPVAAITVAVWLRPIPV